MENTIYTVLATHNTITFYIPTDLEYWKTPSRRLYVAKRGEYDELLKVKDKKRLSLSRKRKFVHVDLTEDDDERNPLMVQIENNIQTVSNIYTPPYPFCMYCS